MLDLTTLNNDQLQALDAARLGEIKVAVSAEMLRRGLSTSSANTSGLTDQATQTQVPSNQQQAPPPA